MSIEHKDGPSKKLELPITIAEWDRNSREVVRVQIAEYMGRRTIDIRTWYRAGSELKPTKSGITLSIRHAPALAEALATACATIGQLGLQPDGGNG